MYHGRRSLGWGRHLIRSRSLIKGVLGRKHWGYSRKERVFIFSQVQIIRKQLRQKDSKIHWPELRPLKNYIPKSIKLRTKYLTKNRASNRHEEDRTQWNQASQILKLSIKIRQLGRVGRARIKVSRRGSRKRGRLLWIKIKNKMVFSLKIFASNSSKNNTQRRRNTKRVWPKVKVKEWLLWVYR
jgi:hypothetical protein